MTWLHIGMAHYPTALLYTTYDGMQTACYLVKGDFQEQLMKVERRANDYITIVDLSALFEAV